MGAKSFPFRKGGDITLWELKGASNESVEMLLICKGGCRLFLAMQPNIWGLRV